MSVESRALGLDPYDALRGTRVPAFIRRNRRARQVVIQLRKRSRLNLAPLLGVKPFVMAKTLGSFAAADARRMSCGDDSARPDVFARALLGRDDIARAGDGAWGYEFDVQTRWAFYASGSPNIIASVFCARGLAEAGLVTGEKSWVDQLHATAGYLERELLTGDGWLRYTPQSDKLVHNANLLGAAVLAASGGLRGHRMGVDAAVRAAMITIEAQDERGGWPYGVGERLAWCDNFHTAYNLDALLLVWLASGDQRVRASLVRGVADWERSFFAEDGAPEYYRDGGGPRDIHSAGTAIDVAARLATHRLCDPGLSARVARWTRENLTAPDGTTWYQERNGRIDRRHFVRWGDAHLALGTASLALLDTQTISPLEAAVKGARQ